MHDGLEKYIVSFNFLFPTFYGCGLLLLVLVGPWLLMGPMCATYCI